MDVWKRKAMIPRLKKYGMVFYATPFHHIPLIQHAIMNLGLNWTAIAKYLSRLTSIQSMNIKLIVMLRN
jgi:hypothetical protein